MIGKAEPYRTSSGKARTAYPAKATVLLRVLRELTAGSRRRIIGDQGVNPEAGSAPEPSWIVNRPDHRTQVGRKRQIDHATSSNQSVQENLVGAAFNSGGNHRVPADYFHGIASGLKQSTGGNRSVNYFDLGNGFKVETDDHYAPLQAVTVDELCHGGREGDKSVRGFVCFHFQIDHRPGRVVLKEIQDLIESRKKLAAVVRASELWMGLIEPTAHVYLAKLRGRHAGDYSLNLPRSPQGWVVNYDWNAVACQADVQLDPRGSVIQSSPESDERIFRSQSRSTAVADDQGRSF